MTWMRRSGKPWPVPDRSVAIVIPVLNEADNLGALLDNCRAQEPAAAEVIVVDAGSTDGSWELLQSRRANWPALKLARVPGATPGRARNEGIGLAESEVIATLDAGSRVGPGWLAALAGPVSGSPARVACVGVAEADARSEFERATGWFTIRAFKPLDRPGPIGSAFLPPGRNGYCFTRSAWEDAGGYPAELPWGEDKVFLKRLRESGRAIVVVPEAVVRWRPRRSLAEVYRQYAAYGRGDVMAGLDRQNEVVTLALYSAGGLLALRAANGSRGARTALAAGVAGYLSLFVAAAARELGPTRATAWVPLIRVAADVGKIRGFTAAALSARRDPSI